MSTSPTPAANAAQPPTPPIGLAELQALAARHGFDDVRVTSADPHSEAARLFAAWLAQGRHADMHWAARDPERRTDPGRHLPGAQAVLMFALSYQRPVPVPGADAGRIARYAAGLDYHRAIDQGLKGVIRELEQRLGGAYRYYVDYGPFLERAFAERAGLGFVGRNANLIHRRFGSYVFIGTIITDAAFAPTPPAPGTCGQCRRCLDICPTGALRAPHELDARLCISYLTIENRGPIPRHLRPLMGNWVFGCDLCQEVCPYNTRVPDGQHPLIVGRTVAGVAIDLAEVLGLRTDAEFDARFQGSAVRRAKREGLLRNAAVAAGNARRPSLLPALRAALADDSPLVRGHVVWALGQMGDGDTLQAHRARETDAFVVAELAEAL